VGSCCIDAAAPEVEEPAFSARSEGTWLAVHLTMASGNDSSASAALRGVIDALTVMLASLHQIQDELDEHQLPSRTNLAAIRSSVADGIAAGNRGARLVAVLRSHHGREPVSVG